MRSAYLLLPMLVWSAETPGIRPRAAPADYTPHVTREGLTIGAAVLTPDQVRKSFVADVHRAYVVVEVAIYPTCEVELELDAFQLRLPGTQNSVRPATPRAVASALQKTAPSQSEVTVYPAVGVGYETGGRRGSGWWTSVGVGVGVDKSRPASTEQDRKTMELELSENGLPEGAWSKPVAGYLYFPVTPGKKTVPYELEFDAGAGRLLVALVTAP
jgi:hypothetical protein